MGTVADNLRVERIAPFFSAVRSQKTVSVIHRYVHAFDTVCIGSRTVYRYKTLYRFADVRRSHLCQRFCERYSDFAFDRCALYTVNIFAVYADRMLVVGQRGKSDRNGKRVFDVERRIRFVVDSVIDFRRSVVVVYNT